MEKSTYLIQYIMQKKIKHAEITQNSLIYFYLELLYRQLLYIEFSGKMSVINVKIQEIMDSDELLYLF